ncbi:hypothetical protein [Azohydromonas sediminis]|uniref:hypothetical protein n=1 Tax=Azohydromonas sediminis TaxID=2259674 RepID=UPI000E64C10B|nr:hypothetical protein [Azohydromonas sediminis]
MNRKTALELGLKTYTSGTDCKHGHKSPERYTSTGSCVQRHREIYSPRGYQRAKQAKTARAVQTVVLSFATGSLLAVALLVLWRAAQ